MNKTFRSIPRFGELFSTVPDSYWVGFFIVITFFCLIWLVVEILYILTLQNTLKAISPVNRQMPPGQVWLLLIPLFRLVWIFIVVDKISKSIEMEYRSRGMQVEPKPSYNIGLAYAILKCCFIVPILNSFCILGALVCWIIYWVKLGEYKNKLRNLPPQHFSESQIFGNTFPGQ